MTTDVELVDLHLARQRGALGRDHRASELLQDQPCGLIPRQAELALELLGRDPGVMRGDEVGGPEPQPQRRARAVHDCPRRHRSLVLARGADPQVPTGLAARAVSATARAAEPVRPARREQVLAASLLGREALLELQDRPRGTQAAPPRQAASPPGWSQPDAHQLSCLRCSERSSGRSAPGTAGPRCSTETARRSARARPSRSARRRPPPG